MEKIKKEDSNELFLKWGNKKRLRCVRVREGDEDDDVSGRRRIRRKVGSNFVGGFGSSYGNNHDTRLTRNSNASTAIRSENTRKSSPEKGVVERPKMDGGGGVVVSESSSGGGKSKQHVWPKLYITLTSKEKEEDFMAMKGCKPSHRPKKRAKMIQRTILLVSPGASLIDMCRKRYEVREKKNTRKRPTGLKAMGSMESDSE